MAGLQRGSVLAIVQESTPGELKAPSSGDDFIKLRSGTEITYSAAELTSDELNNDIGVAKSFKGEETPSGTQNSYIKPSGVVAQEPETGLLIEACLGGKSIAGAEYDTVSGSTVSVVNVDTGEGASYEVGEGVLVKHGSNPWEVRNIGSISTDALSMSFNLANAPVSGVNLGRAVLYKPGSSYPSLSAWLYNGNGYCVQALAGATVGQIEMTFSTNNFGEMNFTYEGVKYFFNPIEITSSSKFIDWTDDDGTFAASVNEGFYRDPIELAKALEAAMNEQTSETITVKYSSIDGKFTIASSTSSVLSLLWDSGTNAANTIGTKLGFNVAADDTSALTYSSDNAQAYEAPFTPVFDNVDPIILKGAELMIGTQEENLNLCASEASITISKELENVLCFRSETGIDEKVAVGREVTMDVTLNLAKHEVNLFNHLLNNTSIKAALTCGPKTGGNWIPGKVFNAYFANAVVTQRNITGDNIITAEVSLKGFVTSTSKDVYINYL